MVYLAYYNDVLIAASEDKGMLKTYLKRTRHLSKRERDIRSVHAEPNVILCLYEGYLLQEWYDWILTTNDITILQDAFGDLVTDLEKACGFFASYGKSLELVGMDQKAKLLTDALEGIQDCWTKPKNNQGIRALLLMHPLFSCNMEQYLLYHREFRERESRLAQFQLKRRRLEF